MWTCFAWARPQGCGLVLYRCLGGTSPTASAAQRMNDAIWPCWRGRSPGENLWDWSAVARLGLGMGRRLGAEALMVLEMGRRLGGAVTPTRPHDHHIPAPTTYHPPKYQQNANIMPTECQHGAKGLPTEYQQSSSSSGSPCAASLASWGAAAAGTLLVVCCTLLVFIYHCSYVRI